jgi:hypothetical protein
MCLGLGQPALVGPRLQEALELRNWVDRMPQDHDRPDQISLAKPPEAHRADAQCCARFRRR